MEGGGRRASEDKRCPDLRVDCGTGVPRFTGLRVCPGDTPAAADKTDAQIVSLGDEARV